MSFLYHWLLYQTLRDKYFFSSVKVVLLNWLKCSRSLVCGSRLEWFTSYLIVFFRCFGGFFGKKLKNLVVHLWQHILIWNIQLFNFVVPHQSWSIRCPDLVCRAWLTASHWLYRWLWQLCPALLQHDAVQWCWPSKALCTNPWVMWPEGLSSIYNQWYGPKSLKSCWT